MRRPPPGRRSRCAQEGVGRAVGNQRMTAEGHADQAKGNARQAKEDVKDTFRH
ncbi:CsbD family protein [Streptomyces sp. NPDC001553]|uniref:CsbD family protein n=1 Tax=Streptomyces sp. NPDC001553 TaxID=3154385 RepID=UPI00332B4119